MPPLVIDDCVQVTINGDAGDGPFANVFAWNIGASADPPAAIASDVLTSYIENILPVLCTPVTVSDAYFIDMRSEDGDTGTVTYSGSEDTHGAVTAPQAPPQVVYLVQHDTTGGRGTRGGRTFLPGVREDEVESTGVITTTTRGTVGGAFAGFVSSVETANDAIFSIIHRGVSGPNALTPVTSSIVQESVATLRRRLNR